MKEFLKTHWYLTMLISFFLAGTIGWRMTRQGGYHLTTEGSAPVSQTPIDADLVVATVDKHPVTLGDIEWEYQLQTTGLSDEEQLTAIPELGSASQKVLAPLKENTLSQIIERKLLYAFISQDERFDLTNPSRYVECLGHWQEAVGSQVDLLKTPEQKERLKARLCEHSLIKQYLSEQVYRSISVSDAEIADYFDEHRDKYNIPEQVTIKQIVLGSEAEAKKVRSQITRHNFEALAREHSITPESEQGGLLGPFAKGSMPPVFDAAFTMRRGEIRGILKSTYGFHIFKLIDKTRPKKATLASAKDQIRKEILKVKQEQEFQKWTELALGVIDIKSPKPLW